MSKKNKASLLLILGLFVFASSCEKSRQDMDVSPLESFAETYEPMASKNSCDSMPKINENIEEVIRKRVIDESYKKSIALIFIKQYRCNFVEYGQAQEVKPDGALYSGYRNVMGRYSKEYITTADVFIWLKNNRKYLKDKNILIEIKELYQIYLDRGIDPSLLPDISGVEGYQKD